MGSKLLLNGRKLVKVGRKLALATAACIARCCAGGGEFYILNLCNPSHQPPEVPRIIAVLIPFTCTGCPLASEQIVIYRGYCYKASQAFPPCEPLACADGRCESPHWPRSSVIEFGALIVNGGELQCKPLDATCNTVPCVPEEPGCCSQTERWDCPDGTFGECDRPKRFRVLHIGESTVKEWCTENFDCISPWFVILDYKIKWNYWYEYQCEETGGDRTQATCRAWGGEIIVQINTAIDYYANVRASAGTWRASGCDLFTKGTETWPTELPPTTLTENWYPACGARTPEGTLSEVSTCADGRRFHKRTISGAGEWEIPGTSITTEYQDCNYKMYKRDIQAFDPIERCRGQIRWDEHVLSERHHIFVTACPDQPPPPPMPDDARSLISVRTTPPKSTGELI